MISVRVDEAYAYDLLAIAAVKRKYNPNDEITFDNIIRYAQDLTSQLGDNLHIKILNSDEYINLCKVNEEMYLRINEIKQRQPTGEDAEYIDTRVYQRFLAKKSLQEKWFPNVKITEQKFGYK